MRAIAAIRSATRSPPSSLTACAPPSFIEPAGVARRPARRPPGRLTNGMSPTTSARRARAAHHARVVDHLVERHRQRRLVALHDHAEAVADEQHVDAGLVDEPREGEVVGGDHRDLLAARLSAGECRHGDASFVHLPPPAVRIRIERPDPCQRSKGALACGLRTAASRTTVPIEHRAFGLGPRSWRIGDPSFRALSMRTRTYAAEPTGELRGLSTAAPPRARRRGERTRSRRASRRGAAHRCRRLRAPAPRWGTRRGAHV